jgi:DnaJ-domain-containing protein 1
MLHPGTPQYWFARFALGLTLLVTAGLRVLPRVLPLHDPIGIVTVLVGGTGFWLAYTSITPLLRWYLLQSHMQKAWSAAASEAFARASLPRRVWYLLASVAEADGPMTAVERDTVRRFVLERFLDPIDADELHGWESQPLHVTDRRGLAARIAAGLGDAELDSLFCWCCLVAFADGRFAEPEHGALQEVATGLGLPRARVRMLFHLARAQFLGGRRGGPPTPPPQPGDTRTRALEVLGLPPTANPDQIRRRHRELVKRFHPDAQPNLGPVAQREATERFHEIQRAYETLTT